MKRVANVIGVVYPGSNKCNICNSGDRRSTILFLHLHFNWSADPVKSSDFVRVSIHENAGSVQDGCPQSEGLAAKMLV